MRAGDPAGREILAAVRGFPRRRLSDGDFERLALATWTRQRGLCAPLARFAAFHGDPEPRRWTEIPALPVSAFKTSRVACFPPSRTERVFRTSGTTRGRRGEHPFATTQYYDAAIDALFPAAVAGKGRYLFAMLVPPSRERPDSSLSYMGARCAARFGTGRIEALRGGEARFAPLARALGRARKPVLIFSTTLALAGFLEYLDSAGKRLRLPAGSKIMETGGAKGRERVLSRRDLLERVRRHLNVPPLRVVNEYGMTELSSQFYGAGIDAWKSAPPWTRVAVIDPADGRLRLRGKGLLRIWDLANRDSCAVLQTEDMAEIGPKGFRVLGRAPGADLRGCSLTFEELERLA